MLQGGTSDSPPAEALRALTEERAELERAARPLSNCRPPSISDEQRTPPSRAKNWGSSSKACAVEKLGLEIRQRELEREWEAARTRVTTV